MNNKKEEFLKMKTEHFAVTITDKQEIENFYHNILGMTQLRNFTLNEDLAREIFNITLVSD